MKWPYSYYFPVNCLQLCFICPDCWFLLLEDHDILIKTYHGRIVHFTIVCLVSWSWVEVRLELTLFRKTSRLSHVNHVVVMLTSLHLHMKSRRFCIKTRSLPASLPLKGQITKYTNVKWTIVLSWTWGSVKYSLIFCIFVGCSVLYL